MIKIEVIDTKVYERNFTRKDGKELTFRSQKAFAHLENRPYPVEFNLQLWDRPAFEPGTYYLTDKSFKIDKYSNLGLTSSLDLAKV